MPEFPKSVHPAIREAIETLYTHWNQGRYRSKIVSAVPTYTGEDGEEVTYISGSTVQLYRYNKTAATWQGVALT